MVMSLLCEERTVSTMAAPICPAHTFSMVFPPNRTRCALHISGGDRRGAHFELLCFAG